MKERLILFSGAMVRAIRDGSEEARMTPIKRAALLLERFTPMAIILSVVGIVLIDIFVWH